MLIMKSTKIIAAALIGISLTVSMGSCNIYKKYSTPDDTALLREYKESVSAPVDSSTLGNMRWEEVFTDPMLADLIRMALDNNVNLANAKLNVDIAHAQLKGARLSYLPSATLAPNGSGSKFFVNPHQNLSWTYQIPLSVSWEIDIFGKLLNGKRGAQAGYEQSKSYQQAVRSQIIAGVANCYYGIATLERQLQVSRATAQLWAESVQTMKDLKEAGRSGITEAAVVQSKAQYASIMASITDTEVQLHELNNTMSLLLGVMPQEWVTSDQSVLSVPALQRATIPMAELASRPDVRAAEYSLAAAYYNTAGARAAFYPSLSISSNGGFTNLLGSMVVNPGKWFIQLAGQLSAPLFSRGANISRLKAAKAQQEQAMNTFENTLLSAAADVSEAMMTYNKATEKSEWLADQVANLEQSVEINQTLLKLGGYNTTYLEVITAQQSLLGAQMGQLSCDLARSRALINLYQNLGGGR